MSTRMSRMVLLCAALALALPLAGCGGNQSDLHVWVARVKARHGGHIPPVPKPQPYQAYTYQAGGMRSPFLPVSKPGSGVSPNLHRKKQFLEQFPLDSLQLVGEITVSGTTYGLIQDPQGLVHRVTVGNYMGQNNGKITAILPTEIRLTEIVPSGNGGWVKRPASLSLAQKSGG